MSSKDLKPNRKLGQTSNKGRVVMWVVLLLALAGGSFAAYRYSAAKPIEVATVGVRKGEFTITVRARGEIRSTRSITLSAPQVPSPRIVKLAESGRPIKAGAPRSSSGWRTTCALPSRT